LQRSPELACRNNSQGIQAMHLAPKNKRSADLEERIIRAFEMVQVSHGRDEQYIR